MRRRAAVVATVSLVSFFATPVLALSLASKLHAFIADTSIPLQLDVVEPITPIVQRVALRGIDFPIPPTTPDVAYAFNFESGSYERSSESLGPSFLERAATVGKGWVELGASYLYANLTDEGGESFGKRISMTALATAGGQTFAGAFRGTDFSLVSHVISFSATYGITNRWDVNVLVPLVYTVLDLKGRAAAGVDERAAAGTFKFSDLFSNDAFGPGDLLLRTKYRFLQGSLVDLAGALALRLPTGSTGDFQGLGDTTLAPSLIASRTFGRHDVHGQLGVEVNADDLERTRARYGFGVTLQPWDRFAFLLDLIGSSSFVDDRFDVVAPPLSILPVGVPPDFTRCRQDPSLGICRPTTAGKISAFVPRSDVLDVAPGFKVSLGGTVVAFASAIVPITSDGLRAEVIPAGGVEFGF